MSQLKSPEIGYCLRVRTSTIRLARWTGLWVAATALMSFGPVFLWNKAVVFTLFAVGLSVAVGAGMILANKNYLAELDELQRKVYLDAMAITVGVAVIVPIPYKVLEKYAVIPFHADVEHLMMLMSLTFVVSLIYGTRRYQ